MSTCGSGRGRSCAAHGTGGSSTSPPGKASSTPTARGCGATKCHGAAAGAGRPEHRDVPALGDGGACVRACLTVCWGRGVRSGAGGPARVVNWVRGSTSSCLRAFARACRRVRDEPLLRSYRTEVYEELWREAAKALGSRGGAAIWRCPGDPARGRTTWVHRQEVALDPAVTLRASLEKSLAHEFLAAAGISIPDHLLCDVHRLGPALGFLREHPEGVVVKPAGGTGGGDRHHRQCPHRAAAAQSGAPRLTQDPAGARRGARARPRSPAAVPGRRTA